MSDMQFQTDDSNEFGRPPTDSGADITGALIKWGLVSSRQEAQYVLIGVAALALVVAIYFFMSSGAASRAAPPQPPNMAPAGTYTN